MLYAGFSINILSLEEYKQKETADRSLKNVRVRRKIIPGEKLEIYAKLDKLSRGIAIENYYHLINNEPAVSFEVTVVILNEIEKIQA